MEDHHHSIPSSCSWSHLQDQQSPKKPNEDFLLQQRDEINLFLSGFRKISLPTYSFSPEHKRSFSACQRSYSDPLNGTTQESKVRLPLTQIMDTFSSSFVTSRVSQPQCHESNSITPPPSAALPPPHPRLRRTVSTPIPPVVKSVSPSSSCVGMAVEFSPEAKRMKRMNNCMMKITQWNDKRMEELEDDASSPYINTEATKVVLGTQLVEESVWVEKVGECTAVHFKCPCSRGYQILISGRNCYYKLM